MRHATNAVLIIGYALSSVVGPRAECQTSTAEPILVVGTRVRVSSSTPGVLGSDAIATVLDERAGMLLLRPEGTQDSISLPLGSITRLEVSAGRSAHAGKGLAAGFLGGAAIGAVVGAATQAQCPWLEYCPWHDAVSGGFAGGMLGMAAGYAIGKVWKTENWDRIALEGRKVGIRVGPSGTSGLTLFAIF